MDTSHGVFQRREAVPRAAPPIVHDVLRSPGRPLDQETQAVMGARFGRDFSMVRVYADSRAAESASAVNANAYTVGSDIVFGVGRYQPHTAVGRRLLAHEIAHVVQQSGHGGPPPDVLAMHEVNDPAERAADEVTDGLSAVPVGVQRQPARPAQNATSPRGTSDEMSRAEFENKMRRRLGVFRIHTGSFEDQATAVNTRRGVRPAGRLTRQMWTEWQPGTTSPIYRWILDGFEDFESRVGGLPPVQEITFFDTEYTADSQGNLVPDPNVGADFGGGLMRVYRRGTTANTPLPFARSNAADRYPGMGAIGIGGIEGQSPGAPLPFPSLRESVKRTIEHELGHGLAEQAHNAEPDLFDQYQRAGGWFRGKLFDIGIPAVRAAITAGVAPPASSTVHQGGHTINQPTEITPTDWNHPRWLEQPVSHYMVSGGPGEDFAEAVMTYVESPALLRSRCPSRYAFLESHRERWLPYLYARPPVGDFPPAPKGMRVE